MYFMPCITISIKVENFMKNLILLLLVTVSVTGCFKQDTLNANTMTYDESQSVLSIKRGVVIAVDQAQVSIDGSDGVGAVSGIVGGLLGSQIGKGTGKDVGIGLGALGGAILGKTLTGKTELAFVYTIDLQNKAGIIQVAQTGQMLPQRSKVLVRTFSGGRKTISLDQSQGITFSETNETAYEGDAAAAAAKKRKALATAKYRAAAALKRAQREEAEYQLEFESKKLSVDSQRLDVDSKGARSVREEGEYQLMLESKKLDIKEKTIRTDRTDDFIDSEIKREESKTKVIDSVGNTINSVGTAVEKNGINLF